MSLVIDASLTMAWYFDDESTDATDALLDRVTSSGAVVPGLWRLEIANAFETAVRRQRIDAVYRDTSLAELSYIIKNGVVRWQQGRPGSCRGRRARAAAANTEQPRPSEAGRSYRPPRPRRVRRADGAQM